VATTAEEGGGEEVEHNNYELILKSIDIKLQQKIY
jgi:hypothetical protein